MVLMGLKLRCQQGLVEDVSLSSPISRGCPYSLAYVCLFSVFKASLIGPSLHHGATSLVCFFQWIDSQNTDTTGVWEQEDQVSNPHPKGKGLGVSTGWKKKEAAWSEAWGKVIQKRFSKYYSVQAELGHMFWTWRFPPSDVQRSLVIAQLKGLWSTQSSPAQIKLDMADSKS